MNVGIEKILTNFPLYLGPKQIARYLARYELYKHILGVEGCVIECGVAWGGGLMWLSHLKWLLEPHNITRHIYGFDTFDDENMFPHLEDYESAQDLDMNVFGTDQVHLTGEIEHFYTTLPYPPMVHLVKGDAIETIPKWCSDHSYGLIALLLLDFDVYMPTRCALEYFLPRMPKGALVVFDECNSARWPGETIALLESVSMNTIRLERFPWCPMMAWHVIEE